MKTVRFDLSDLLPPAFGAKERAGMWRTLQRYLQDPAAINSITRELEKAAFSARECEKATGGDCT
ncbi:MAG: hypothetical protein H0W96_13695 [Solirubrobacterales bacterium]|nr:hypothetical protein [Solirubrobacterales bacterium]